MLRKWLAGAAMVVLLVGGVFAWTRDRPGAAAAEPEREIAALTAVPDAPAPDIPLVAPVSDVTPLDREARRFQRYDKDRDGIVSQAEYLLNRKRAFDRMDVDGNGVLSFAESAVKGVAKFSKADADRDGKLEAK